ncbi:MAG TPA: glutamate--tRNA ligase [Candidatus Megaira endosymbiont of Hartmannula sinica]|nr:glutamate--tRNA ligase [Candidatus Megaera endosymbiont of Hartmannula sinica]
MTVVTRFAPSPSGYLHIGGARTALFNYLFARRHNGRFLLRIEDSDKNRSGQSEIEAIIDGLNWLGMDYDGDVTYQSRNKDRHLNIVDILLKKGLAYYCFLDKNHLEKERDIARKSKRNFVLRSPWRDKSLEISMRYMEDNNIKPVVRLKTPLDKKIIIDDLVQGKVVYDTENIEDFIILRDDKTPTFMLANSVDDNDQGVNYIIRGDDHLNNWAKQILIYQMMEWDLPRVAHIPLIHSSDGSKMSKRHGSVNIMDYKKQGYLNKAIFNYLLRLGWSFRDEEIISRERAIDLFSINNIGKSPAKIDFDKMKNINSIYLRDASEDEIFTMVCELFPRYKNIADKDIDNIKKSIIEIKPRAVLLNDLPEMFDMYISDSKITIDSHFINIIKSDNQDFIEKYNISIKDLIFKVSSSVDDISISNFNKDEIQEAIKIISKEYGIKIGLVMKYVRFLICGVDRSPSVFHIISIIGKEPSINRLAIISDILQ